MVPSQATGLLSLARSSRSSRLGRLHTARGGTGGRVGPLLTEADVVQVLQQLDCLAYSWTLARSASRPGATAPPAAHEAVEVQVALAAACSEPAALLGGLALGLLGGAVIRPALAAERSSATARRSTRASRQSAPWGSAAGSLRDVRRLALHQLQARHLLRDRRSVTCTARGLAAACMPGLGIRAAHGEEVVVEHFGLRAGQPTEIERPQISRRARLAGGGALHPARRFVILDPVRPLLRLPR